MRMLVLTVVVEYKIVPMAAAAVVVEEQAELVIPPALTVTQVVLVVDQVR